MRLTDFWERMHLVFGARAEFLVADQVLAELGNRTPAQALAAGESTKDVWRAVCEGMEVPVQHR